MLIKAFLLLCLLAGVIHGLTESNPGTDNEFEACWERCYQVSITREVLYRKIKYSKNIIINEFFPESR